MEVLDQLVKGKLRDSMYPCAGQGNPPASRPADVIVFVVGGVTYEESLAVQMFNRSNPGVKVLLGGSTIHNCRR